MRSVELVQPRQVTPWHFTTCGSRRANSITFGTGISGQV